MTKHETGSIPVLQADRSKSMNDAFVTVEAKALSSALKLVTALVERRNTIPILSTVRLSYTGNGLVLDATDLDLAARIEVDEIDGRGNWTTCVQAHDIAGIAAAAGVAPLLISPKERTPTRQREGSDAVELEVEIVAGVAVYTLKALNASDFPEISGARIQRIERFTNGHLAEMLGKVAHCISTEETRYYLNGVNWSSKDGEKRFAATDGHRLAVCKYSLDDAAAPFSYILPRKSVRIIQQFLAGADVEIYSVGDGNKIKDLVLDVKAPGIDLRIKLIDGTYPDFKRVIPLTPSHHLHLRKDELLNAVKQATALKGPGLHAIRLHGIGGHLHVETKNLDDNSARVATSAPWPEQMAAIGVNGRYMSDIITTCQGEIKIGITDPGSPLLVADDDKDMTRVVMPMRV